MRYMCSSCFRVYTDHVLICPDCMTKCDELPSWTDAVLADRPADPAPTYVRAHKVRYCHLCHLQGCSACDGVDKKPFEIVDASHMATLGAQSVEEMS